MSVGGSASLRPRPSPGLGFERHAPRFLLVETQGMSDRQAAIESVLGDRYTRLEALSPYDVLYRRDEPAGTP